MKKEKPEFLILNGPNINLLGIREPEIYGRETYQDLVEQIKAYAQKRGVAVEFYQSNHEGDLVDAIQKAYFDKIDGIVFNPAAYTHTSVAIPDALKAVSLPAVEVHISDVDRREEFRRHSYTSAACIGTIKGRGLSGYADAIRMLKNHLSSRRS